MCRLTAYLGAPAPLAPLLFGGDHSLLRQSWAPRELLSGSVNADGWGVAWWHAEATRRLARAEPAWFDEDLQGVLSSVSAACAIAALRNATPGLGVDRSSIPPLVRDRWAFVLNGYVPDFRHTHMRALRQGLPDHLYGELRGSSDAETLFLLAVDAVERGATLRSALEGVIERVRERVGDSSEAHLTMVLADGSTIVAVRESTVPETNSLYVAREHPLAPEGLLLASERLDGDDRWEAIPAHGGVVLRRDGVEMFSSV